MNTTNSNLNSNISCINNNNNNKSNINSGMGNRGGVGRLERSFAYIDATPFDDVDHRHKNDDTAANLGEPG